jgi:hypothetical protein
MRRGLAWALLATLGLLALALLERGVDLSRYKYEEVR